ncbi:hypothetical protein C8F04DRAFT_1393900 [Mycena alexandri]|uniref:Uncharacterized protein n=1 Tax=Mycena alexandri TaxID=1745969 RepID=A0AAD6X9B5_9AGAR|nr:hypothetical protein C8F04DRAFT_1393900 [Mycena alexandri]
MPADHFSTNDWVYDWDRGSWRKISIDYKGHLKEHERQKPRSVTNGEDGKWEWVYDWDRQCWWKKYLDEKDDDDKNDDKKKGDGKKDGDGKDGDCKKDSDDKKQDDDKKDSVKVPSK